MTAADPGEFHRALTEQIRTELAAHTLDHQQLAHRCGVEVAYLTDRLEGRERFTFADIDAVAAVFEMTGTELIDRAVAAVDACDPADPCPGSSVRAPHNPTSETVES